MAGNLSEYYVREVRQFPEQKAVKVRDILINIKMLESIENIILSLKNTNKNFDIYEHILAKEVGSEKV